MPLPPTALQLPKVECPPPPSLPGCFPSCSALLSPAAETHTALPPSPQASLPREARGEGGTAPSHTNPEVSIVCHPPATAASSLTRDVFFVSGSSIPAELPWEKGVEWRSWSPPKEGAWSQGCRHQIWGGFETRVHY